MWVYTKLNDKEAIEQFKSVEILNIEIAGLFKKDNNVCQPCRNGVSDIGSKRCEICPKNTYFNGPKNGCKSCPKGTYSMDGSNSVEQCHELRPCLISDIDVTYSECIDHKRTMSFRWHYFDGEEAICLPNHPDTELKSLPDPTVINCKGCGIG